MIVLYPRTSNLIVPQLVRYHRTLVEMGWSKKYMDLTFVGSSSTDNPLKNVLNRERLLVAVEYAMRKTIKPSEQIPFKVVDGLSPLVADTGMGLIVQSEFTKYFAQAVGFTVNDIFFMVFATPTPGNKWNAEQVRTATRMFEHPEDGKFHCDMHPSQWNIGVFNKRQPDIFHAVVDLESIVPPIYAKLEVERLTNKINQEEQERKSIQEINTETSQPEIQN